MNRSALIAGVATDAICFEQKQKYPILDENERLEMVAAQHSVDEARFLPSSTEDTGASATWIAEWDIELVVAGGAWKGSARWKRLATALSSADIRVTYAPVTPGISTSQIADRAAARKPAAKKGGMA